MAGRFNELGCLDRYLTKGVTYRWLKNLHHFAQECKCIRMLQRPSAQKIANELNRLNVVFKILMNF